MNNAPEVPKTLRRTSPETNRRPVRARNRPPSQILHFPFVKPPIFKGKIGTWGLLTSPSPQPL